MFKNVIKKIVNLFDRVLFEIMFIVFKGHGLEESEIEGCKWREEKEWYCHKEHPVYGVLET